MAEGVTLLREALASGRVPEAVFYAADADAGLVAAAHEAGAAVYLLEPGVMEKVADAVTPQPVCAIIRDVAVAIDALAHDGVVVVAVDVRDPGNAGTLLRSAAAAGAAGVVLCSGSVELGNPKTVRSTAGAIFKVPVVTGVDAEDALRALGAAGRRRLAAVAHGGTDYTTLDLTGPVAFVLGNETHGLPPDFGGIDGSLTIPLPGPVESLNVGVAAAVLCFEAARQVRAAGRGRPGVVA